MTKSDIIEPHGNELINLLVNEERGQLLKNIAINLPDIILNERQMCDLELIATGAFSPLTGFMNQSDYESVLDRMRLQNSTLWPVPICLDISSIQAQNLEAEQSVAIKDPEGFLLAVMHIQDIWKINKEKEANKVYGTLDINHPGVNYLLKKAGNFYIGGNLEVINLPLHFNFQQFRMSPHEVRAIYKKLGWQRVIGFQTRSPIHRPQFEMTIRAMKENRANLLLLSAAGVAYSSDEQRYTIVRCYRKIAYKYPPDSMIMNLLPLSERIYGQRNTILNMIIAKNYGCTHFIIGHNPSDFTNPNNSYQTDDIIDFADRNAKEIGVVVIPLKDMVYLPFEDEYKFSDDVPKEVQKISFSNTDIMKRIRSGKKIPEWSTFPEVIKELKKSYPPPQKQGFTLFLTGYSGAGKSTIAKVLYSRFLELGGRPVTLLDGDIVRRNLSRELNFSKEHRDINVRRIGFVASEITKNRGIAICAPIAPYESTRNEIRQLIEKYGGFIEVHISTPIEECEKRDRKGMYAKARAGLIKGFTGVDDPYEIPISPELSINTLDNTPNECVQEILLFLSQKGYI